jgi:hypothetical protein
MLACKQLALWRKFKKGANQLGLSGIGDFYEAIAERLMKGVL